MPIKKGLLPALALFIMIVPARADIDLGQKLAGRILLQVEEKGEAWYVNPADHKKYYLGRPADAFNIMRQSGLGISNEDLKMILVGVLPGLGPDTDNDGLPDSLEDALKTDKFNPDTDNDGYNDYQEINSGYDPLGPGKWPVDAAFSARQAGRIFLQVEENGEAWYVNPPDLRRYYLARPHDAFEAMRSFGLGITNSDLSKIKTGTLYVPDDRPEQPEYPDNNRDRYDIMELAAAAIRANNPDEAAGYFHPDIIKRLEYTLKALDGGGRLLLGNALSGAKLESESAGTLTYKNELYFSLGGYGVPVKFYVEREEDGQWYLMNL